MIVVPAGGSMVLRFFGPIGIAFVTPQTAWSLQIDSVAYSGVGGIPDGCVAEYVSTTSVTESSIMGRVTLSSSIPVGAVIQDGRIIDSISERPPDQWLLDTSEPIVVGPPAPGGPHGRLCG